jgi:nucleotide-binding universal stress UspA family protein
MIPPRTGAPGGRFRRVVVAFDGSADEDLAAVEAAAAFAARLRADLLGLFIEDIDLARLAEHAGITTICARSAGHQRLGAEHLKTALKAQLARTREAVERAAERQRIRSTFEVRRGRLIAEILSTAVPADLVIIGWRGGPATSVMAPGTPASAVLAALSEASVRFVLVPRQVSRLGGPVLVAYDGSVAAREGLAAAAEIGGSEGGIEVALLARRVDDAKAQQREAAHVLAEAGIGGSFIHLRDGGPGDLLRVAEARRATLLVVPVGLLDAESARRVVERAPCPLLLVR